MKDLGRDYLEKMTAPRTLTTEDEQAIHDLLQRSSTNTMSDTLMCVVIVAVVGGLVFVLGATIFLLLFGL